LKEWGKRGKGKKRVDNINSFLKAGGDRKSNEYKNQSNNITLKRGTNKIYITRRLKRDAPELAEKTLEAFLVPGKEKIWEAIEDQIRTAYKTGRPKKDNKKDSHSYLSIGSNHRQRIIAILKRDAPQSLRKSLQVKYPQRKE